MSAGTEHPVFKDGYNVEKAQARARIALRYGDAAEVRALDLSDSYALYIGPQRFAKTDEYVVDDGINAVQDRLGNVFVAIVGDAYDIPFSFTRGLGANEFLGQHVFVRPVYCEEDFDGALGFARATSTGSVVIRLMLVRDGVSTQIGTVTYSAGLPAPVFEADSIQFIRGDVLQAFAPVSSDATLADVAWTLPGKR